jgi:hypothetical protein
MGEFIDVRMQLVGNGKVAKTCFSSTSAAE